MVISSGICVPNTAKGLRKINVGAALKSIEGQPVYSEFSTHIIIFIKTIYGYTVEKKRKNYKFVDIKNEKRKS